MRISLILFYILFPMFVNAQTGNAIYNQAKKSKNSEEQISLYIQSGDVFYSVSDYNSAVKSYLRAYKNIEKLNDKQLVVDVNIKIADTYTKLEKPDKSINYLLEAKLLAYNLKFQESLITIYEQLAVNYSLLGDNVKSDEYSSLLNSFNKADLSEELKLELEQKQKSLNKLQLKTKVIKKKLIKNEVELSKKNIEIYEATKSVNRLKKISDKQRLSLMLASLETKNIELELKQKEILLESEQQMKLMLAIGFSMLLMIIGLVFYYYQLKVKNHKIIDEQNERITSSINYAKRIQDAAMPQENIIRTLLPKSFILNQPKDIVSGDFYWIYKNPNKENSFFIAAVDCTGHGVPGAFMSMIGINQLNEIVAKGISNTAEILDELNVAIVKMLKQEVVHNQDGMDMALCRIDLDDNLLEFSGARNPLVYIKNNTIELIKADRMGIGGVLRKKDKIIPKINFSSHQIDIRGVSHFYIFTDGYADQISSTEGKKITPKRFYEKLVTFSPLSFEEQKDRLWSFYDEWRGEENRLDDVLVIGFSLN